MANFLGNSESVDKKNQSEGVKSLKEKPYDLIFYHIDKQEAVAQYIYDGGTALEYLEPYGFSKEQAEKFITRFLPTLIGYSDLSNDEMRSRVKASLTRIAIAKRLAGVV